ncbi:MAG: hypothetical protein JNL25_00035 [Rhodospirillaceae bacterium]|nr:hypothetical protein [Rhodospirillaceae bacterium]
MSGPIMATGKAVILTLPIRLTPRRGRLILTTGFMLIWCGGVAYAFSHAAPGNWPGTPLRGFVPEDLAVIGIPLLMLAVGLMGLIRSALLLLPGSPFDQVVIDRRGLRRRRFFTRQQVAWSSISEFAAVRLAAGKSHKWILLAEGRPAPIAATDKARFRAAPLTVDLTALLPVLGKPAESATEVVVWLNGLLNIALAGRLPREVAIPGVLAGSATPVTALTKAHTQASVAVARGRSKSVIER